jgi:hypothetical protein
LGTPSPRLPRPYRVIRGGMGPSHSAPRNPFDPAFPFAPASRGRGPGKARFLPRRPGGTEGGRPVAGPRPLGPPQAPGPGGVRPSFLPLTPQRPGPHGGRRTPGRCSGHGRGGSMAVIPGSTGGSDGLRGEEGGGMGAGPRVPSASPRPGPGGPRGEGGAGTGWTVLREGRGRGERAPGPPGGRPCPEAHGGPGKGRGPEGRGAEVRGAALNRDARRARHAPPAPRPGGPRRGRGWGSAPRRRGILPASPVAGGFAFTSRARASGPRAPSPGSGKAHGGPLAPTPRPRCRSGSDGEGTHGAPAARTPVERTGAFGATGTSPRRRTWEGAAPPPGRRVQRLP